MNPLKSFGKKHIEIVSKMIGSGAAYGATAGVLVVYMSDWKTVLQYLPYYNGKYEE